MVAICPCCRQIVASTDLLVSVDTGTAMCGDKCVHLTPHEVRALYELRSAMPATASYDGLAWAVYQYLDEPENMQNSIHVLMRRLRRKIAPLDMRIVAARGLGYRLEVA